MACLSCNSWLYIFSNMHLFHLPSVGNSSNLLIDLVLLTHMWHNLLQVNIEQAIDLDIYGDESLLLSTNEGTT